MTTRANSAYNPVGTVVLDRDSPVPLYFQLAQHFEDEIRSGNLDPGDRLENEVKIAEDLGLSRPTVRAAFSYLVDKGLVLRRRGQGTVVTKGKVSRSVKLTSLFDDLAASGKRPTTRVLHNEVVRPSDLVKGALELDDGQLVIFLERLRFGEGEPIALMHNFIPTSLVTLSNDMLEGARLLRAASGEWGLSRPRDTADLGEERVHGRGETPGRVEGHRTPNHGANDLRCAGASHRVRSARVPGVAVRAPVHRDRGGCFRESGYVMSIDSSY